MKRFDELFIRFREIDIPSLERKEKEFNFTDVFKMIEINSKDFRILDENRNFFNYITPQQKDSIINQFREYVDLLERLKRFNPEETSNPRVEWQRLIQEVDENYKRTNDFRKDVDVYLLEERIKILEEITTQTELEKIKNESEMALDSVLKKEKQITKILEAGQEAFDKKGIAEHAKIFEEEANRNRCYSLIWLIVSIISFLVLFGIVFWVFVELLSAITDKGIAELELETVFTRVLIISFASILLYQFLKNYNASMHQYYMNKHRANSLWTFKVFYEGTNEPEIKNAILLAATKAVFEIGDTGYVSKKDSSISPEIITTIFGKKQE